MLQINHAYLVIMILIIEQLQILMNAHAIVDITMMDQIQFANLAIIHGFLHFKINSYILV